MKRLSLVVPLILAGSALLKLVDWGQFRSMITTLYDGPASAVEVIAASILWIECVPFCFLIARYRICANVLGILFILMASLFWFIAWLGVEMPVCACFGRWTKYTLISDGATGFLFRNAILVIPAFVFLILMYRSKHRNVKYEDQDASRIHTR